MSSTYMCMHTHRHASTQEKPNSILNKAIFQNSKESVSYVISLYNGTLRFIYIDTNTHPISSVIYLLVYKTVVKSLK